MKTATNHPKSLCKRDGKGASSACHWRNWKASESAIRPPRPSPTGITGAPTDIVSNSLADFAVNGCKDPPCCQLRSKGFSVFNSGRHCPRKFRFAPSASSVRPVLGSWLLHTRRRLLNLLHPPTGPGLKTSGSTKRSFFRTRFLFAIITGRVSRSTVCISCRSRRDKDRCVRLESATRHRRRPGHNGRNLGKLECTHRKTDCGT